MAPPIVVRVWHDPTNLLGYKTVDESTEEEIEEASYDKESTEEALFHTSDTI